MLFYGLVIHHHYICIHTHNHLNSIICWWAFGLLPHLAYCIQIVLLWAPVSVYIFKLVFSSAWGLYIQELTCWITWRTHFKNLFKEAPYCFPQCLHQRTFSPMVLEGSLFSTSSSTRICRLLTMALVTGVGQSFTEVLVCISLKSRDAELLVVCLLTISMSSLENVCSSLFAHFWLNSMLFLDIELCEMYWFLKYADFYLKGKSAMLPPLTFLLKE